MAEVKTLMNELSGLSDYQTGGSLGNPAKTLLRMRKTVNSRHPAPYRPHVQ